MRGRLGIALVLGALLVPAVARANVATHTALGDWATVTANGCRVTKNPDHSISVACPRGHWAKLQWHFLGTGPVAAVTVAAAHRCRFSAHAQDLGRSGIKNSDAYVVTEPVHHTRIDSVTLSLR